MPRVDIASLPSTSRTWLFGISPSLDGNQSQRLLATVDQFLDEWAAHGTPVTSAGWAGPSAGVLAGSASGSG